MAVAVGSGVSVGRGEGVLLGKLVEVGSGVGAGLQAVAVKIMIKRTNNEALRWFITFPFILINFFIF